MKHLYAPWRAGYVSGERPPSWPGGKESCFFCDHARSRKDRENLVLARESKAFVLLNLYPYNDGHLMVAPYRHTGNPSRLSKEEWLQMQELCLKALSALEKILKPHGFNTGMNLGKAAGAGTDRHIHLHVVPRWTGDTNFMPVLNGTKTINQNLKTLYERLKPAFC